MKGRFQKAWIEFNSDAQMHVWEGETPLEQWFNDRSDYVGSTNFDSVIRLFARLKIQGVPEEEFPKGILCISDTEFNPSQLNKTSVEAAHSILRSAGFSDEYIDNLRYLACEIRIQFNNLGYSDETISDMLVQKVYGKESRRKQILWFCYGQYIVNNLENNLNVRKTKHIQCIDCGEWVEVPVESKRARCENCSKLEQRRKTRMRVEKYRKTKCSAGLMSLLKTRKS